MKKKLVATILISAMCLVACAGTASPSMNGSTGGGAVNNENNTDDANNDNKESGEESKVVLDADPNAAPDEFDKLIEDFAIKSGDVVLKLGDDFTPNIDKLGTPYIEEDVACLEDYSDTNYYYDGEALTIATLNIDDTHIIYDMYASTSDYETVKGAKIGTTTLDEVVSIYGEPTEDNSYFIGEKYVVKFGYDANNVLESIEVSKKQ